MDIKEAIKSHPSWKQLEQSIEARRAIVLREARYTENSELMLRAMGELFAYEWILGNLPDLTAERIEEQQEKTK